MGLIEDSSTTDMLQSVLLHPETVAKALMISLWFVGIASEILLTKQAWQLLRPKTNAHLSVSRSGERTRAAFLILLWAAGLTRLLSFGGMTLDWGNLILMDTSDDSNEPRAWLFALLLAVPGIVFLSTYSVIILFWAQVYYTARFMVLTSVRTSYWFINSGVYLCLIAMALLTRILHAYVEFQIYVRVMTGILYTITAITFCYFGLKVTIEFSGDFADRQQDARRSAVARRVLLLSLLCPFLFQIRGLYCLAVGFGLVPLSGFWEGQLMITWDLLTIFLSEWVPSALVLLSFWPQGTDDNYNRIAPSQSASGHDTLSTRLLQPNQESYKGSLPTNDILLNFAPASVYPIGGAGTRV